MAYDWRLQAQTDLAIAESQRPPVPADVSEFTLMDRLSAEDLEAAKKLALQCPVCLDLAVSPCETTCGHLVCLSCVVNVLACPICREPLHQPTEMKHLKRYIERMTVTCVLKPRGCPSTHLISESAKHTLECPFLVLQCACGKSFARKDISHHLATRCSVTEIACPEGCLHKCKRSLMRRHLRQCPKLKMRCACGAQVERGAMPTHQSEVCPETELHCSLGCPCKVKRRKLSQHNDAFKDVHLSNNDLMLRFMREKGLEADFRTYQRENCEVLSFFVVDKTTQVISMKMFRTIGDLKTQLHGIFGIPENFQILTLNGRPLDNATLTLAAAGVTRDASIRLSLGLAPTRMPPVTRSSVRISDATLNTQPV
eukprot:gb/GEZN01007432.1/.p1 GENE.gb/GEZN01007432.1/~~gb/GEZN01007432.1/.p1  ORF type:complete len:393 (-),score=15.86 gb/GEZN01007432.1/:359-1465(-)